MEQVDPTGKLEKATSPSIKKATGFSKLSSKVARKRSLKGRKQEKRVGDPLLTHTADSTFNHKASASPSDSCAPKSSFVVLVPLTKSSSKSEDSLDSGIYSGLSKKERQKSCDSVDSIGSTGSASYNMDQPGIVVPHATAGEMHGATQPMNANKYDDYWREYQDIRQSIIAQDEDSDEKRSVTRTDSGEDEDESDWLRQAGLAGLVTSTNSSSHAQSELENTSGKTTARLSTDSLTSMTILNTLTRPQREAVLRRITSFNRVQKSKRLPIHAIFPQSSPELPKNQEGLSAKPPMAPPVLEVSSPSQEPEAVIDELVGYKTSKSTSLPYKLSGYEEGYQRRYSEVTKRSTQSSLTETDKPFSSLISAFSTSSLDTGHVLKLDQKGYQRKEALDSIVATEPSGGIETLSIQSRSVDDATWRDNFAEDAKTKQAVSYSETADQENLPNFSLVRDRLGITRISDLSTQDMHKVQSLALIELTALFDLHNIELKRRKFGKVKMKETGLFGITLIALLDWDQKRQSDNDLRVPMVLQEIITFLEKNGLEDEGILRVPGSAVRIKNLKQELAGKFSQTLPTLLLDPNASWNEARTNDVAAVLKQFLRELPNPLLSMEYIDAFQSCDLIPDRKQQLQALNLLIILLNNVHRDSLKLLLKFLSKVVAKEEINKMTLNNVAMIMAPNLFMGRKQTKKGETPTTYSASQDVKHAAGTSNVVRMLIKYHKLLWTVPTFMLTQVRNMNQAEHGGKKQSGQSREKIKIKFPGITKTKDPQIKASKSPIAHDKFDYEVPKGVIRVKVENHSMTSMAVQLDGKCTAGDVIAKFQKQCERAKQMSPNSEIAVIANETHALYEVGGNIFERCLDPGTNMHALTKINPDATWIIKKRPNL